MDGFTVRAREYVNKHQTAEEMICHKGVAEMEAVVCFSGAFLEGDVTCTLRFPLNRTGSD
jgi:hypothetical protein